MTKNLNNPKSKFISFRWRILFLILTPLLLAIISTQLILWLVLQQSNNQQKKEFFENRREKIENYLKDAQEEGEKIISINRSAVSSQDINVQNLLIMERYFWYQMKYVSKIYQVYYSNEKGDWVAIKRDKTKYKSEKLFSEYRGEDTQGKFKEYELTENGQKKLPFKIIREGFNPHERPWYREAKQKKKFGWIKPYKFKESQNLGITLYQAVINPKNNQFEGVIGIDFNFSYLTEYLNDINVTSQEGKFFIIDCSSERSSFNIIAQSGQENKKDHSQFISSIQGKINEYCQKDNPKSTSFINQNNTVYMVSLNNIIALDDYSWLLIINLPNNYFMQEATGLMLSILLSGIFLSLIAVILALFASRKVSEPVTAITDAAAAIESENFQSLSLDKLQKIAQKNDELGGLAKVFLKMIKTIYQREESLKKQLENLENSHSDQSQFSLFADHEYIEQLIKKAQSLRHDNPKN
ncbi:putative sensor with HAMP domain [Gloeothece citriformis PCC 7424]|uniref:Putative sensor with HAMP domain n=1 Tax=Gloeothece citriformis (strain PCC 7424) TaxID=65393 RepID=B7KC77_GLOC7|nr:cache domain-containing protein [Gloeothece citriformis]ACK70182.1 putative sensor with HAMP domain [Gloeothece citriformis PCC 7424]